MNYKYFWGVAGSTGDLQENVLTSYFVQHLPLKYIVVVLFHNEFKLKHLFQS